MEEIQTPKPKLYPNTNFLDYLRWDCMSATLVKELHKSPRHYKHYIDTPRADNASFQIGSALHCAVLEPERFELEYDKMPKFDRRTKLGKASHDAWEKESDQSKEYLVDTDYYDVLGMRDAILMHPDAKDVVDEGLASEVSAVFNYQVDEKTKLLCKCRPDLVGFWKGYPAIVDIKTTRDASQFSFARDIHTYAYHIQAAFYCHGFQQVERMLSGKTPHKRQFIFIAVEKKPPYHVCFYPLGDMSLAQGERDMQLALEKLVQCKKTGVWPSYYDNEAVELDMPFYAIDNDIIEDNR